jgi:hypothetical protein
MQCPNPSPNASHSHDGGCSRNGAAPTCHSALDSLSPSASAQPIVSGNHFPTRVRGRLRTVRFKYDVSGSLPSSCPPVRDTFTSPVDLPGSRRLLSQHHLDVQDVGTSKPPMFLHSPAARCFPRRRKWPCRIEIDASFVMEMAPLIVVCTSAVPVRKRRFSRDGNSARASQRLRGMSKR